MANLVKIFYSPAEVFRGVDESAHWAIPFFTVLVVTLAITAVLLPTVIEPEAVEAIRSRFEGSDEQLQQALRMASGPRFYAVTMVAVLVTAPLKMLAQAGVFALILPLLGGEVDFRKILGVTAYSAVVSVFGGVVKGGIMLGTKSVEAYTNLTLFFPGLAKDTYLFRLLTSLDFFTIWSLLLFGLGLSTVGKVDRQKSYVVIFCLWFVLILALSYVGGITGRFRG